MDKRDLELGKHCLELEKNYYKLVMENNQLQTEIESKNLQISELNAIISDMMNSTSWKITAPLRHIKEKFRGE